jgi:hypothetical protein
MARRLASLYRRMLTWVRGPLSRWLEQDVYAYGDDEE